MPRRKPPKKLSKADKERLKREEEEKKAREEEEARLREEQERKEQLEREREEAEERKRIEKEELSKRSVELNILREILGGLETSLAEYHETRIKEAKWNRYMLCDKSPDPFIPQEIHTFMNLWREDNNRVKIDEVLVDGALTLRLIRELLAVCKDMPSEEKTFEMTNYVSEMTDELEVLLQEKLDRATHEILVQATNLADPETANLQSVWDSSFVTLCLWGNLSKNPRIKSFEFGEQGISFEIPKPLTLTDCAFRCMFLTYDHLSHRSPTQKKKVKVIATETTRVSTPLDAQETGEEEEVPNEEEKEEEVGMNLMDELGDISGDEEKKEEEEKVEEEEEKVEEPEEDREMTPPLIEYEYYDGPDEVIDLRNMEMIGGIFYFDLLVLPPQPKTMSGWTMTRILEPPTLERLVYPDKTPITPTMSTQDVNKSEPQVSATPPKEQQLAEPPRLHPESSITNDKREKSETGQNDRQPILVTRKIPPSLCFIDQPVVGRWDAPTQNWCTDGIEIVSYKEAEREVSFRTAFFGPMALFQDAYMNFPFQSWEMRPMGPNHCCLSITAAVVEVDIEVKGDKCYVMRTEEEDKNAWAENLYDKPMIVPHLVQELRRRGVSVFGRKDSNQYCDAAKKNALLEQRMHSQMALLSSVMAFAFSRWNRHTPDNNSIIVQAVEHLSEALLNEDDLGLYKCTRKKVIQVTMSEFDAEYNDNIAENTEFHADFYNTYLEKASDEGKDRLAQVDHLYYETVCSLLNKVRPFSFA